MNLDPEKIDARAMHIDSVTHHGSISAQPDLRPHHPHNQAPIIRKPVPANTSAPIDHGIHQDALYAPIALPDIAKTPVATSTQPPQTLPPSRYRPRLAFLSSARSKWSRMSKRTKILIAAGIAVLLILIIGLSVGLAVRSHRNKNLPLPASHGGPYTGDLTYYAPGLGACGVTSTSTQNIVAVSHLVFDAVSTSSNPNANSLCGKKIRVRRKDKSVDVTVVDRCVGCKAKDLDVSERVFGDLANIDQGRVTMQWAWLEDVSSNASSSLS